ncbi:V-type ATPase 116kDa subunit family protein [Vallitaleaceae bacterium 9-2]
MAVEKMRFVNIAGRIAEMDDFVIKAIVPFDIQLENAMYILDSVKGMQPFSDENPYERLNEKVADLISVLDRDIHYDPNKAAELMPIALLEPEIDGYERQLETIQRIRRSLKVDLEHKKELRKQIIPLQNLDVQVDKLFHFDYMRFRFGKMPKDGFEKLIKYVENLDTITYKISEENESVYVMYFTPHAQVGNIDSLFASLFFERIWISEDVKGRPKEALQRLNEEIEELENRIQMLDKDSQDFVERNFERLQELYNFTIQLNEVYNVRQYALRSKEAFYLTGWIPLSQVEEFQKMVDDVGNVSCIIEDDDAVKKTVPPTRLRNHRFFKPFETLVQMYGTPGYNELDPTTFLAITYMIFFGIMFGDVGQGLVIALAGGLFFKKTQNMLGKIAVYIGIVSSIAGVFYGSFFGNEEILRKALPFIPMINPMDYKIPVLGVTVVFGIGLLIIAMILNIINAYKQENYPKMLLDRNGIIGLIFYLTMIYLVFSIVMQMPYSLTLIVIFLVAPLVVMFFEHPLANLMNRKKQIFPKDKGGFIIETVFELIETLLSILSNTLSFMRVGAFALNHVGFFMAFHALADIVGGTGSIGVMIFGNILIIVLEGLIVAIQGIRLEYYELFSKFFEGNGTEFKPFKIKG